MTRLDDQGFPIPEHSRAVDELAEAIADHVMDTPFVSTTATVVESFDACVVDVVSRRIERLSVDDLAAAINHGRVLVSQHGKLTWIHRDRPCIPTGLEDWDAARAHDRTTAERLLPNDPNRPLSPDVAAKYTARMTGAANQALGKVQGPLGGALADLLNAAGGFIHEQGNTFPGIARFTELAVALDRTPSLTTVDPDDVRIAGSTELRGRVPADVLAVLLRTLDHELGVKSASHVMAVFEGALRPSTIDDREIAAAVKKIEADQLRVAQRLAGTEGLKTGSWYPGRYHVTYDGVPIGSVHATKRGWASHKQKAKLSDWVPTANFWHLHSGGSLLPEGQPPCKTVTEAVAVVLDAWQRKQQEVTG